MNYCKQKVFDHGTDFEHGSDTDIYWRGSIQFSLLLFWVVYNASQHLWEQEKQNFHSFYPIHY